jgi:hypothetical protein
MARTSSLPDDAYTYARSILEYSNSVNARMLVKTVYCIQYLQGESAIRLRET